MCFFNFAEREACGLCRASSREKKIVTQRVERKEQAEPRFFENWRRTSYREYEEDAWVHEAEEGRGDRRNVWGELHASEEPQESEWGNPSRVMSGDPVLNT